MEKPGYKCTQKKSIEESKMDKEIYRMFKKVKICKKFKEWGLQYIDRNHQAETFEKDTILRTQRKTLEDSMKQLDNLVSMRLKDLISDEEFTVRKQSLLTEQESLKRQILITEQRKVDWVNVMQRAINFVYSARDSFVGARPEIKKSIMMTLGSNFLLNDGNILLERHPYIKIIGKNHKKLEKKLVTLELDKNIDAESKKEAIEEIHSIWLGRRGSNPRPSG